MAAHQQMLPCNNAHQVSQAVGKGRPAGDSCRIFAWAQSRDSPAGNAEQARIWRDGRGGQTTV